ncbi:MAG: cytochrome c biogenesis CcdA family protein [Acidimicrobiia bacterium]
MIYAFTVGMLATVNPCGFAMLPAYLSYFLGADVNGADQQGARTERQVGRALIVGPTVSLGFMSVFLVLGSIVQAGASWIHTWLQWATIGIGFGLVALGIAMLRGYHLPFATPRIEKGGKDRTLRSLFLFGVSYGVASISCGIQFFLAVVFEAATANGIANGIGRFLAYGAGMGLIITALTVSMALARQGLLQWLRVAMRSIDRIAGVLLIVTGAYLVYYWTFNIVTDKGTRTQAGGGLIDRVESLQSRLSNELNNWGGRRVGITLGLALAIAVLFVVARRKRHRAESDVPPPTDRVTH